MHFENEKGKGKGKGKRKGKRKEKGKGKEKEKEKGDLFVGNIYTVNEEEEKGRKDAVRVNGRINK